MFRLAVIEASQGLQIGTHGLQTLLRRSIPTKLFDMRVMEVLETWQGARGRTNLLGCLQLKENFASTLLGIFGMIPNAPQPRSASMGLDINKGLRLRSCSAAEEEGDWDEEYEDEGYRDAMSEQEEKNRVRELLPAQHAFRASLQRYLFSQKMHRDVQRV